MTYTPQTWQNLPVKTTPIDATRLTVMEQGIADAHTAIDGRLSDATLAKEYGSVDDPTNGAALHVSESGGSRTVALTGHSLVYGQDTTAAGTTAPTNGSTVTRSATPTTERFNEQAKFTSPGLITTINQSYPGDRTAEALTRWAMGTSGAIEFFWIDTNDGTGTGAGVQLTDAQTAANLRDLVARARSRGADVVVLGGSPSSADIATSRRIFASAETERTIAERLGARYVDVGELLAAFPRAAALFSSGAHLTAQGYSLVGSRIAALLGPKGVNPPKVGPGRVITPRDQLAVVPNIATRAGAADGSVWVLGLNETLSISVDVTTPCVPIFRARVNGTTGGFGSAALYYNLGSSGYRAKYIPLVAGASIAATNGAYVYIRGDALLSPGPEALVLVPRVGNLEIDSVSFVPVDSWNAIGTGAPDFDTRLSRGLDFYPVGGSSVGRSSASWDVCLDTTSGVSLATNSAGSTYTGARWLFDLTLGPSISGVILAQSVYPTVDSMIAQGYMIYRAGTSLIVRKFDAGTITDTTYTAAFASATGNVRCTLEIYFDPATQLFSIYLDGALKGTVASAWKFYMAGLIAGAAGSLGYSAGTGTVTQPGLTTP